MCGRDVSIYKNLLGRLVNVKYIRGFDGVCGIVMIFYGRVNSYI